MKLSESFVRGFGDVINPDNRCKNRGSNIDDDARAIKGDWERVGEDIRRAYEKFSSEGYRVCK